MMIVQGINFYITQLTGWRRQFVAFIFGGVTSFGLAPFNLIFVGFISFPILIVFLDTIANQYTGKKRLTLSFLTCWSFGFGYFVFSLWWLSNALLVDPLAFAFFIPFAVFGLPAFLALYYGLAGVFAIFFWQKGVMRFVALAMGVGIFEWLRAILFTGFPWGAIGYTIMPTPLFMQSSAVIGLYGMNVFAVFVYAIPTVFLTKEPRFLALLIGLILIISHVGFGAYRLKNSDILENIAATQYNVRLVQPSIPQDIKMDREQRRKIFATLEELSTLPMQNKGEKAEEGKSDPDFIIWPETAVPYILEYAQTAKTRIADMLKPKQWAIVGSVRTEGNFDERNIRYFNTIQVINKQGHVLSASDKLHLVPFGEYIPFEEFFNKIGLKGIAEIAGGYSPALKRETVTMPNGFTFLPMICYEVIFPNGMEYSGKMPQAILNVTNDAWFGVTPGPYHHFQQARLRAVEQGLYLIRAANNGISAVVDPYGRIVRELGLNKVGVVDASITSINVSIWNTKTYFFHLFGFIFILVLFVGRMYSLK